VSKITEIIIILVLTKCCVGLTAEPSDNLGEHFAWVYWDTKKREKFVLPIDLAPLVEHPTYLAFGVDEAKLQHLLEETQNNGRKTRGRQSFEIVCYAIQSKDDKYPVSFTVGQGVQITKQHFGTRQFVIVALLWSNTRTFTFLLMEKNEFDSLEKDTIDPSLDGNLTMRCSIPFD